VLDLSFNVPTLLTAGLSILAFVVWLVRLEGRVKAAHDELGTTDKKTEATYALVLLHKEQAHAYQLQAAKEFTTQAAVAEIKRDVLAEITRMEARLEAQIDRLAAGNET
jgi:hypothetical protein